jgi:3-deoxy-D-manno-octulosonic acid kinase
MSGMKFGRVELRRGAILFDPSLSRDPGALFDRDALLARGALADASGGRGSISYLSADGRQLVLRRYLRGGLPARLSRDRYLWLGEERTRAFLEFRLLAALLELGLPVPRPVAARYLRSGLTYRGELVTERLPGAESLARRWLAGRAGLPDWVAAGRCIRRFHDAGVQHADLNANNIMLDDSGGAWLLDFDRGRLRSPGAWRERSLARLGRSLRKISSAAGLEDDWHARFAALRSAHDAAGG